MKSTKEDEKKMESFFEKKKTEKNLNLSANTPDQSSFYQRKENEDSFQERNFITTQELNDRSLVGETKRAPPLDESKSIKNFFASSIKKQENSSIDKTTKAPLRKTGTSAKSGHYKKGSPGKPNQYSKLSDREKEHIYLDVYDENLQLKKKEENLVIQIKQMNSKMQVIQSEFLAIKKGKDNQDERVGPSDKENLNSAFELKSENQRLKEKLKALSQAKSIVKAKPPGKTRKIYSSIAPSDERLTEAMRLIDIYKKRLKVSETQLRSMQEASNKSGHLLGQSDVHSKNIKLASLQNRYEELMANMESQKNSYDNSKRRMEEINDQLFKEREENTRLKKEIRGMELSVSHIKDVEAKAKDLEDEKRNLNMRIKDLCESPFIKQHEERNNLQYQVRTQESTLQKLTLENKSLHEMMIKTTSELERTQKLLDQTNNELKQKIEQAAQLKASLEIKDKQLGPFKDLDREDDAFLKALGMVKWQGEEPAWSKLDFLERPQKLDLKDPESLLKEIERLRLEKGELAAQLEKSQTLLKIQMESEQEQIKIYQSQITTLELQLKGAILRSNELSKLVDLRGFGSHEGVEIYEKNGVKYDDRVSVFSDDSVSDIDTEPGANYLEVWLGEAEFDENAIKSLLKSKKDLVMDVKRILTFLIVDFYNHDSQNSSIAEGTHTNFNFQMSFRVLCDEIFLHYLESGFLKLELYISEGMDTSPIAKANIPLKDLIKKSLGDGIAPALNSSITLFGEKNQIIGILNYRMRMKYSIGESLKWMKEKRDLGIIEEEVAQLDENIRRKRKLVIIVDKATGLSARYNTFVAYTLDGKDFHTTPQPGQNPRWDHTGIHDIEYDETFVSYLKSNVLEFVLLDDNVPLISSNNLTQEINDLIGFARLSINGLINNEIIDSIISVYGNKNEKRGTLHVKIFWHEGALPKKPMPEDSLITKSWEQELILRISAALRSKQLNVESAFMIFDQDRDHIVNAHDFQSTLLGTLNLQIHKDEIELLYQKMPSPLTRDNFIAVFGQHLPALNSSPQNRSEISKLNVMLQNNTMKLNTNTLQIENTKKMIGQKFAERIRQTSQISLFKDLDKDNDGYISLLELKAYFLGMGLKFTDDELYSFISGIDLDRNNRIDIKEFLSYVLSGFTTSSRDQTQTQDMMASDRYKDEAYSRSASPGKKIDSLINKMMDNILTYMKNNKLTFLKLYERIDKNKDNFLSKTELNEFLKKIGLDVSFNESNSLLNHLDENGDNKISIKEFIDKIKEFSDNRHIYSLYDDEYKQVPIDALNEKIVEYISQYLVSTKTSIVDFFNNIDKNDDGIISREELNVLFLKTLKLTFSRDEESTFFNYLDKNRDNKIQIPEFNSIMKPSVERTMKAPTRDPNSSRISSGKFSKTDLNMSNNTRNSQDFMSNLQNKVYDCITNNLTLLRNSFVMNESKEKGFVTRAVFIEVLMDIRTDTNEFRKVEIDAILDNLCEKNYAGLINFDKFLTLSRNKPKKFTNFTLPNESSRGDLMKSQKMAKEIFGKIAKVVKENHVEIQEAFKTFDYDKDGTIDVEEFKKAFEAMKLSYTQEDVEEIIGVIGVNGKVNYQKFIEALKLK